MNSRMVPESAQDTSAVPGDAEVNWPGREQLLDRLARLLPPRLRVVPQERLRPRVLYEVG